VSVDGSVFITDTQTAAKIPVDGVNVPNAGANPPAGQSIRQAFVHGKSDGSAHYADPDGSGNLNVNVQATTADTSDAPHFVALTGDPSGDFAGVDLAALVLDNASRVGVNVTVLNSPKEDAQGALIASDAPAPILLSGVIGSVFTIDTTGYQSLSITTGAGFSAGVSASNDPSLGFMILNAVSTIANSALTGTLVSGSTYLIPCLARYIRLTFLAAGSATAYLRAQVWSGSYNASVPGTTSAPSQVNISQIGMSAVVSAGTGLLGVGGGDAVGGLPSVGVKPVQVAGADAGGLVRRILTDTSGRTQANDNGVDVSGTVRQIGVVAPGGNGSPLNIPALAIMDASQHEGNSRDQILAQMLTEMKIANLYAYAMGTLGSIHPFDDPDLLRADPSFTTL